MWRLRRGVLTWLFLAFLLVLSIVVKLPVSLADVVEGKTTAAKNNNRFNSNSSSVEEGRRVPRPEDSANGEGVAGFLAFECLMLAGFAASQLSLRRQRERKSRAYYKMVRTSPNSDAKIGNSSKGSRTELEMTDIP